MNLMLKKMREAKGLTQQEVADELGIKVATYRTWEQASVKITLENTCRCALILGCSPNDISGWYEEHPRDALPADDAHRQIVAAFDDLSEEGREVAVNVVSGMARTYPQAGGPPRLVAQDASA